jgi:hypothetical protein
MKKNVFSLNLPEDVLKCRKSVIREIAQIYGVRDLGFVSRIPPNKHQMGKCKGIKSKMQMGWE